MTSRCFLGVLAAALLVPLGARGADEAGEARTIELTLTKNGFEPARVKVTRGQPLKLVVTRTTDETCAKDIVVPDQNIEAELPLGKPVTLSFTPKQSGEIRYSCAMNMITGVLQVASSDDVAPDQMHGIGGDGAGSGGMRAMRESGMHAMRCRCMHGEHADADGS
jgi:hypothetical protein